MSRSIPLSQVRDHAIVALYQNGERLRPEQGHPLRLLVRGWEGNINVKWLHRLKLTSQPMQTRDETSHYRRSRFARIEPPRQDRRELLALCDDAL